MDKIGKIKRLVESSLDTSFGGDFLILEIQVIPTQKFDHENTKWIPDSYAIFLTIKDNRKENDDPNLGFLDEPTTQVTSLIENVLGFDACVAIT